MRQWIKLSAVLLTAGVASTSLFTALPAHAEDAAPAAQPTKEAKEAKEPKKVGRLVKPWSTIEETLTAEQKSEIIAIHQKAVEEIKAINKKEDADIMALLKPEQVEALKAATEKVKAEDKMKTAEKKDAAKKPVKDEPKED